MVKRKGAGYSLEAIVAIATVVLFVLGGLSIPENQDWSNFRDQVSSNDLTYALQDSGYLNHAMREGEIGSVQTAVSTITERNVEVSGLISNLPIAENDVAFYTKPSRRFDQNVREVNPSNPSDTCAGDLEEITNRSEEPVLKTQGGELANSYHDNETLYLGDLDPRVVGGNGKTDYDSVWVDNGSRECQFAEEDGPYYLDEIFRWENESYDFEWVDEGNDKLKLYRATQAVRFRRELNRRVNDVETFVSIDAVNFSELEREGFDAGVIRSEESVDQIDSGNKSAVKNFINDGSLLLLANYTSSQFENDDFLTQSGFKYVDEPYEGPYNGEETEGIFSEIRESQDTRTYFKGLRGNENSLSIASPRVLSGSESTIQSSPVILRSDSEAYNFSVWNRTNKSMNEVDPDGDDIDGLPDSQCYEKDGALTRGELEFPDGETYYLLNAELGTSPEFCENKNVRGVKVSPFKNDYSDNSTLLNGRRVEIADRNYALDTKSNTSSCDDGECLSFTYTGDRHVELISHRKSFPEYDGGELALSSYEKNYEDEDLKLLASVIHWLRGDEVSFVGLSPPEDTTTEAISGIQNETYMPYELNMRWSR